MWHKTPQAVVMSLPFVCSQLVTGIPTIDPQIYFRMQFSVVYHKSNSAEQDFKTALCKNNLILLKGELS
jgi:hypothetical protein